MKPTEFCFWLQGAFEMFEPENLTSKQLDTIKRHLDLVFIHHIDPSYPVEQQDALNAAHEPKATEPDTTNFEIRPRC